MDGLLIIDKPTGLTSAEVVRVVKRQLQRKTGHLGTLDPFASGVLPLCIGEGTKIAQFLNSAEKEYAGEVRLGQRTDTGDPTGRVLETAPVPLVTLRRLNDVTTAFLGERLQIPPMYSAIKQRGTPLYKLARQGIAVERAARRVCIEALCLTQRAPDAVQFTLRCSKGTYVRVLAEEIAAALGTVGHLGALRRTRFGHFSLGQAIALTNLQSATVPPIIGLRDSLSHMREIRVHQQQVQQARHGGQPALASIAPGERGEVAKVVGPDGTLTAIIEMQETGRWRFARVFAERSTQD